MCSLLIDSNVEVGLLHIFTPEGELIKLVDSLEHFVGVSDSSELYFIAIRVHEGLTKTQLLERRDVSASGYKRFRMK